MAISLDSIFHPFNDFFVQKFVADGSPAKFRFARQPHAFADSDFVLAGQAVPQASPEVAHELLSLVVDRVMRLDADGQTVWQGPSQISDLYIDEIVGPSTVWLPPDLTDADARQQRLDAFIAVKADAVRDAEIKAASLTEGAGISFRPAIAQPENWWNMANPDVWTHQSFLIKDAAIGPATPGPSEAPLLRMKLDNAALASVIAENVAPFTVTQPDEPPLRRFRIAPQILTQLTETESAVDTAISPALGAGLAVQPAYRMARRPFARELATADVEPAGQGGFADLVAHNFGLHDRINENAKILPFRDRLDFDLLIAGQQATQGVTTSDVTISFDYCVATLTRPWYHRAFVNNGFWTIPGQIAGQLSANDGRGLAGLPVGFVAIKSLRIEAPWTAEDISNLAQSVQFGPFNFDSTVVDGAIGHPGIQIVGWMIEDVPPLPPNSSV